jgi:hypothetical protein
MKVLNARPDFRFQHWLGFAFFPAKTTSCLKITSALYHFVIVVDECLYFADEYSKVSVRGVRSVYSLSCVVDVRFSFTKAVSHDL